VNSFDSTIAGSRRCRRWAVIRNSTTTRAVAFDRCDVVEVQFCSSYCWGWDCIILGIAGPEDRIAKLPIQPVALVRFGYCCSFFPRRQCQLALDAPLFQVKLRRYQGTGPFSSVLPLQLLEFTAVQNSSWRRPAPANGWRDCGEYR